MGKMNTIIKLVIVGLMTTTVGCEYYGKDDGSVYAGSEAQENRILELERKLQEKGQENQDEVVVAGETPTEVLGAGEDEVIDPTGSGATAGGTAGGGSTGSDNTGGNGSTTGQEPVAGTIPFTIGTNWSLLGQFTTGLAVQSYTWHPTTDGKGYVKIVFGEDIDFSDEAALGKTLVIRNGQGTIAIAEVMAFLGRDKEVMYLLSKAPDTTSSYSFTLLSGDAGPKSVSGKKLTSDLKWDHQFTAAELATNVAVTPAPVQDSQEKPTGWHFSKDVTAFSWLETLGGTTVGAGFTQAGCQSGISSYAMVGIRFLKAANVHVTSTGTEGNEIAAGCKSQEYWKTPIDIHDTNFGQELVDWIGKNLDWYYGNMVPDYETVTLPGYALDGFTIRKCKNKDVIIALTPLQVKVSSTGVDEASVGPAPAGKFAIDEETVCQDYEDVDYRCNDAAHHEGLMSGLMLNYSSGFLGTKVIGIQITCNKICLAGESGCPTQ